MLFSVPRTCRRLGLRGLVLIAVVSFAGSAAADVPVSENARKHFSAGVSYLQDPDGARYEEAYREFKVAYADSPSWKILGNLGLAAMKLERDGEAIDAYREYLAQGGKEIEAEERAQVQRDLETMQAGVVSVTIETVPSGALVTDERMTVRGDRVVNVYGPAAGPLRLGLRAGHHRIKISLAGYAEQNWEFDARSGTMESRTIQLQPAKVEGPVGPVAPMAPGATPADSPASTATARPIPTGVYIGLAATGALAIGATVTGIMASSKHGDFEDANDGSDPARAEDLRDSGKTLNVVTDVLFGGAIVAAGVTTVLYLTRPTHTESSPTAYTFVPVAGKNGAGFLLARRF